MSGDDIPKSFGEAAQAFFDFSELEKLGQVLLQQYQYRCAVSGAEFGGQQFELIVFLLQPLEHGGAIHSSNAILVERASGSLLSKGIVQISDEYEAFIGRPEFVEPCTLGANGRRKLLLPESAEFWPSLTMIAYHRSLFRAQ